MGGLSDDESAQQIQDCGIDILVDLNGYMKWSRPGVLARRPAPLQVYWLGHGGGLGLSFIDYIIADEVVIPRDAEGSYREKIVHLPDVFHPCDTTPVAQVHQSRSEFGLSEEGIVFCAFNAPHKIDREVFESWMRILQQVTDSQLWLSNQGASAALALNLRQEAQARGVDPGRLVFATRLPDKSLHLARHRLADLYLDTFSVNASTTALDALWAGLPILTRPGVSFQSRICSSFVRCVGLEELICSSAREYENLAVALAREPGRLDKLKQILSSHLKASALFDQRRFVGHLENAYSTMWEAHCAANC
jgi:protein O-GlcNAc transferase